MCSHMTHQNSKQMVETKQLLEMVQVQTLWSLLNSVQKFQMKASTAVIFSTRFTLTFQGFQHYDVLCTHQSPKKTFL